MACGGSSADEDPEQAAAKRRVIESKVAEAVRDPSALNHDDLLVAVAAVWPALCIKFFGLDQSVSTKWYWNWFPRG